MRVNELKSNIELPVTRTATAILLAGVSAWTLAAQTPEPAYTIAYSGFAPLNTDIFIAAPDGGGPTPFLPHPDLDYNASFSRDGRWIVFTSHRDGSADIFRAHPDGTSLERLTDDPAFDDQASLSPDGRLLAFVSTRGGHAEVWVADLRAKTATNVTSHAGGHFRPAWSPDGEWIAFSSDRDLPIARRPNGFEIIQRTEIYLVRKDGSGVRQITHTGSYAGSPAWSPDGTRIAFYKAAFDQVVRISDPRRWRATTDIAEVEVTTGRERTITTGTGEKWSPRWLSNDRIGYTSGGPERGLEFTTGAAGPRGEFWSPDWSADGRRMIFFRDVGQNWPPVMSIRSRDSRMALLRTGLFPSFSANGDRLAFTTGLASLSHNGLMVASRDGSNRWVIFDDLERNTVAPAWSPAGDVIAFGIGGAFQGKLGVGRQRSNIATIRPDGTDLKLVTETEGNDGFPAWSPDGTRIVYRTQHPTGKGLRIVNVSTGAISVLTDAVHNDNFPSWSPDGEEITFTSDREDEDWEIYAIKADGSGLRRVTRLPGNDAHSSWSPDGQWIAFATGTMGFKDEMALHPHNPQSYGEIAVMRPDGADLRILTDNPWEDATPRWAPIPRSAR